MYYRPPFGGPGAISNFCIANFAYSRPRGGRCAAGLSHPLWAKHGNALRYGQKRRSHSSPDMYHK